MYIPPPPIQPNILANKLLNIKQPKSIFIQGNFTPSNQLNISNIHSLNSIQTYIPYASQQFHPFN